MREYNRNLVYKLDKEAIKLFLFKSIVLHSQLSRPVFGAPIPTFYKFRIVCVCQLSIRHLMETNNT